MANKEYPESGMSFVFDDQGVFLPERDPCRKRIQHKKEWLQPLQEALRKEMLDMKNVFALQDIVVTNEQGARKYGLVR